MLYGQVCIRKVEHELIRACPPLRGTMIGLGKEALLFTRGSVPIYRTYPVLRVARPMMIQPHSLDTPMADGRRVFAA